MSPMACLVSSPARHLPTEVNMPWQAAWGMTDAAGRLKVAFPPTVYYEMVHDPQTAAQINQASTPCSG